MHYGQPLYPVDQVLRNGLVGELILRSGAASFGVEQANDGGQVILDAVIDLVQQPWFGHLAAPVRTAAHAQWRPPQL